MTDDRPGEAPRIKREMNWTTIALIGGLVLLLIVIAYFATNRNLDQDKLTGTEVGESQSPNPEKACAAQSTYDAIKRELFRRAAQLRGSDQAAYDKLSAYAVLRMENPVMESEDSGTSAVNCSGSLSLDLPPGVAVVGGRRTLMSEVDYSVQNAADGSGRVVLLRNADAIITPLATLARTSTPIAERAQGNQAVPEEAEQNAVEPTDSAETQGPATASTYPGHPSFDCADARTKGEIAVCSDTGLSALDSNMAAQYQRAMSAADPEERSILQSTRDRFLAYRDRCPNRQCIGDAYAGRMREIRDIVEGRWHPR
jgi:uncharacterized protein YecT (DUF1311 family)